MRRFSIIRVTKNSFDIRLSADKSMNTWTVGTVIVNQDGCPQYDADMPSKFQPAQYILEQMEQECVRVVNTIRKLDNMGLWNEVADTLLNHKTEFYAC